MHKRFFRGGAHLKHSALYGASEYTRSGLSPLDIHSHNALIKELSIYGNTVDGLGVGTKTANILSGSRIRIENGKLIESTQSHIIAKGKEGEGSTVPGSTMWGNGWLIIRSTVDISAGSVITVSADIRYVEKHRDHNGKVLILFTGSSDQPRIDTTDSEINHLSYPFTVANDVETWDITFSLNSSTVEISNIMVNIGNTEQSYEPYGYKLPIRITDRYSDTDHSFDHYISSPLYNTSQCVVVSSALPICRASKISVDTEVPPSRIDVKYTS